MDAHVDKLLEVVEGCEGKEEDSEIEKRRYHWQTWRDWKVMTGSLSHDLGDLKQGETILKGIKEALAGKDPVVTGDGPLLPEVVLMAVTAELYIKNGNSDRAVAKCEQALKALQKVSMKSGEVDSGMVIDLKKLEIFTRIRLCHSLEDLGQHVKCDAEVETLSQLDMTGVSGTFSLYVRLLQATAAMRRGDTAAFFTHIEEAQKLAADDRSGKVVVKFIEAGGLAKQAGILWEQARVLRQQAAESTEIEVQRQMESLAASTEQEEQQKLKRAAELAGEAGVLAAAEQRESCYQDNKSTAWVFSSGIWFCSTSSCRICGSTASEILCEA